MCFLSLVASVKDFPQVSPKKSFRCSTCFSKCFYTRVTFKIFASFMNGYGVSSQNTRLNKWFSTWVTFVILVPFMYGFDMSCQIIRLSKRNHIWKSCFPVLAELIAVWYYCELRGSDLLGHIGQNSFDKLDIQINCG